MHLREALLEVENRRLVYATVCRYPGVHLRELARFVGLKHNLVEYHLYYLEKLELVQSIQDGMFKRYFPSDSMGSDSRLDLLGAHDKRIVSLLRQPVVFKIIVLLFMTGAMSQKELSRQIRRSQSTINYHVSRLLETELVAKSEGGSGYVLVDPERMERILLTFSPQPFTLTDGFLDIWESLRL